MQNGICWVWSSEWKKKSVHTHTHTCAHTHAHTSAILFFYQCLTLDFTKFTAEEVNSHTQIVLNKLRSFPSNEPSIGFKFKLKFMNTNFNKIKQNLNEVKNSGP